MLPFETLEELNLSSNWFGIPGLAHFKTQFRGFKRLRVLNLGTNKLANEEETDKREFRDVLDAVKDTLEELHINENQIKDNDFINFLLDTLAQMPKLRHLNMARNGGLTRLGSVGLITRMSEQWSATAMQDSPLALERLNI